MELERYISVCEAAGAPTHCCSAGVLDLATASGRMTARITGAVARHEVEHSIERIRGEKHQAAVAGRYRGGRRPFGYEADGITVAPAEAAEVADAAAAVLAGESLSAIARDWTARGLVSTLWHPPLPATVWTSVAVRRVLTRPRNAALIELQGAEVAARWPAIVGEDTWRALSVLCADPSRRTAPSTEARWLGSGIYRCALCGAVVRAATGVRAVRIYRCTAANHLARAATPIDELVTATVLARLSRPDARLLLAPRDGTDMAAAGDEAAALRARNAGLVELFADGVITAGELATQRTRITTRLAALTEQMTAHAAGSPLAGFAGADDVAAAWEAASVSRRKAVIDALMTVTLESPGKGARVFDPATVRIEWRHAE